MQNNRYAVSSWGVFVYIKSEDEENFYTAVYDALQCKWWPGPLLIPKNKIAFEVCDDY